MSVLEVRDLHKQFDRSTQVLRGVSFQVKPQTLFAIVGGNGTGKSTLLRSICGVCRPYRGTVRLFGKKTKDYKTDLFRRKKGHFDKPETLYQRI